MSGFSLIVCNMFEASEYSITVTVASYHLIGKENNYMPYLKCEAPLRIKLTSCIKKFRRAQFMPYLLLNFLL